MISKILIILTHLRIFDKNGLYCRTSHFQVSLLSTIDNSFDQTFHWRYLKILDRGNEFYPVTQWVSFSHFLCIRVSCIYSTFIISLQPSTGGRIVALNASDLKMKGLKTTVMTAGGSDAQRYVTRWVKLSYISLSAQTLLYPARGVRFGKLRIKEMKKRWPWETFLLGMVEKPNDIERGCVRKSC